MPLVVEDGTGLSNANSYVSVENADAYFQLRANDEWSTLEADAKVAALVSATQYIDLRWGPNLKGVRAFETQALEFPRVDFCTTAEPPVPLPINVVNACIEYGLRASRGPLAPDIEYDASGRLATSTKEKVGPIEESKSWIGGNAYSVAFVPYRIPDAMMRGFVRATNGGVIR